MWNGHRMLRHRGHRDELTADFLSKRRDNYPGNFICLPRFLPSSKYFQSLLDDRLSSFFCFLFVSSSSFSFLLLARRQYSASHSPSFKFSYWFLPLFFFFFFFFFPPPSFCCSSPLLRWLYLAEGETYRTTDNYIFRHARLLWRIMGEWVFLEKSWGDSRWRGYSTRVLLVLIIGC